VIANTGRPSDETLARYASEHKQPLELGVLEPHVEPVLGEFWRTAIELACTLMAVVWL